MSHRERQNMVAMGALPLGWIMSTLGEVCEINPKLPAKPDPASQITFVPMAAVCEHSGTIVAPQTKPFSAVSKGYTPFIEGDVIWAKITPCMENGKAAIARDLTNGIGFGSTEFFVLRSRGLVLPQYLHRFVRQEKFRAAAQKTMNSAVGQARVPRDFLFAAPIPLPPLPEQHKIVARLEALEARIRRARAKLAEVHNQLAQARQSLLAAAFHGDDTSKTVRLADVISEKPKNGYSANPVDYETPYRVLSLSATTSGVFLRSKFKYFDEPIPENSPFWLQPGDILVQRGNTLEYVGIPALYDGEPREFTYPDLMMRVRASAKATTEYLLFALSRPNARAFLRERATGTAGNMPKINQQALMEVPIPLPPLSEQHEIVRRLTAAFAKLDAAAAAHAAAVSALDRLDQSLLARAFSGGF
jgi:type I restriction enzyme S subunit